VASQLCIGGATVCLQFDKFSVEMRSDYEIYLLWSWRMAHLGNKCSAVWRKHITCSSHII